MPSSVHPFPCNDLIADLQRIGVEREWLARLQDELADHYAELYADERGRGASDAAAGQYAARALGDRRALFEACSGAYIDRWRLITVAGPTSAESGTTAWLRWATAVVLGSAATATTLFLLHTAIFAGL